MSIDNVHNLIHVYMYMDSVYMHIELYISCTEQK